MGLKIKEEEKKDESVDVLHPASQSVLVLFGVLI